MTEYESQLWMVRHGETEWSRAGRHTSITDLALTEAGEQEAARLAPMLAGEQFDLVLTSPRRRARRTGQLAGFPDAETDDDLVEWSYGDYEGLTTVQIRESVPGWSIWTHPAPGGESADDVARRLDRIVARARGVRRTLVFSHGHASRALAARWLGLEPRFGCHLRLDTSTVSALGFERETPVVLRWNS